VFDKLDPVLLVVVSPETFSFFVSSSLISGVPLVLRLLSRIPSPPTFPEIELAAEPGLLSAPVNDLEVDSVRGRGVMSVASSKVSCWQETLVSRLICLKEFTIGRDNDVDLYRARGAIEGTYPVLGTNVIVDLVLGRGGYRHCAHGRHCILSAVH
jgi:hypothetical protein